MKSASIAPAFSLPRSSGSCAARSPARSLATLASFMPALRGREKLLRQRIDPIGDGAGAESDDQVARLRQRGDGLDQPFLAVDGQHLRMAMTAQAGSEFIAVDAGDRHLAGGIDRRHETMSASSRQAEIRRTGRAPAYSGAARITAMTRPLPATRAAAEHRGDLDGMVGVVVVDLHAVPVTGMGEAALHAGEGGKPARMASSVTPASAATAKRRERVQRIVLAGHRHASEPRSCARRR